MEKRVLEYKTIKIIGEYGIVKCKERFFCDSGKPASHVITIYDVCLDEGNGDIVASFSTSREAKKWAKEN